MLEIFFSFIYPWGRLVQENRRGHIKVKWKTLPDVKVSFCMLKNCSHFSSFGNIEKNLRTWLFFPLILYSCSLSFTLFDFFFIFGISVHIWMICRKHTKKFPEMRIKCHIHTFTFLLIFAMIYIKLNLELVF